MGRACSIYGREKRYIQCLGGGGPEGRNHLKDPGVDGRIILKLIFEKAVREYGLYIYGSGQGQVTGCCECGNKPSDSIKCGVFPD
jgi:hypothetical protein